MIFRYLVLLFFFFFSLSAGAQENRFRFAQTNVGVQFETYFNDQGDYIIGPRILLGASHFWNKADFYISFPTAYITGGGAPNNYSPGVITGGRYLPFGLSSKFPRPIIGIQWLTPNFSLGEGPFWTKSRLGIEAGASLVFAKSWSAELMASYLTNSQVDYPISRSEMAEVLLPDISISLAVKKYFDFTAGIGTEAGKAYADESLVVYDSLKALSTWGIAFGPSANMALSQNPLREKVPFLTDIPNIVLYPDIGLSYYFHKADAALRVSYRPVKLSQSAYGFEWESMENRIAFEGFKFLFDYHGFVPFVGGAIGADHLRVSVTERDVSGTGTEWLPQYALVFGWDIRPNRSQYYLLRTNLRYVFANPIEIAGVSFGSDHLEINFIQLVIYPQRIIHRPK